MADDFPLDPLTKLDGLALDIDFRIQHLWEQTLEVDDWDIETVAAFMRAAYGQGYMDALHEDAEGKRAKLCLDHGYRPA